MFRFLTVLMLAFGVLTACDVTKPTLSNPYGDLTGLSVSLAPAPNWCQGGADPVAVPGVEMPLRAVAEYSAGAYSSEVTAQAVWSSSAPLVAEVSADGIVTALQTGEATITVRFGGMFADYLFAVSSATIVHVVTVPETATVPVGLDQQFEGCGIFDDNSNLPLTGVCAWLSDDETVASVSDLKGSRGLATPQAVGVANISCTFNGVDGSSALTVSDAEVDAITVSPSSADLTVGLYQQFKAEATLSNGEVIDVTETAEWAVDDALIASLEPGGNGLVVALVPGATSISASSAGVSDSSSITVPALSFAVNEPLVISWSGSGVPELKQGESLQLTATANYSDGSSADVTGNLAWSSAVSSVTVVDGLVTAGVDASVGTVVTIIAKTGASEQASIDIDIVP